MPISQDNRNLVLTTPLGKDVLVIQRLLAREAISQLFEIELEILKEETNETDPPSIQDAKTLIGQPMTVTAEKKEGEDGAEVARHFNGICASFSQGNRDTRYTTYKAVLVPHVWLLTKIKQSRIFQQINVPDILKKVFKGFDVKWELQGTFEPRNYCVQYRESDFAFASRLMEEEGIFYFFDHTESGHQMVFANTPQSHKDTVKAKIPFISNVSGVREDWQGAVNTFTFHDQLQTGKYTLWDHHFELVGKKLEAQQISRFTIGGNDKLEIYDYPGEYAQRFDGISKGGGEQTSEVQKIFTDNKRTVAIRQGELDVAYKSFFGSSDCTAVVPGFKFEMVEHRHALYNQSYLIVSARTEAIQSPSYISDEPVADNYILTFTGLVHGGNDSAPFRPPRNTPKPVVQGMQTAVVVGPAGEEIFTDKYGRVKVQFHWDRQGKSNADSSCWVRVAQTWAGKKWGTMFIPRIGMEMLVDFLEGDPDRPIIIGSVPNAENMPPYTLPDEKTKSTIKTNSSPKGGGFNEIRFEDKKGSEQIFIHAEKDQDIRVKNDTKAIINRDKHLIVERDHFEKVKKDKHLGVTGNQVEKVGGNVSLNVGSNKEQKIGTKFAVDSGQEIHLKAGMSVTVEAGTQLTLKVGGNFININPGGVFIKGTMVMINSGGAAGSGSGVSAGTPKDPLEADKAEAGQVTKAPAPPPPVQPPQFAKLAELVRAKAASPAAPSVAPALAAAMSAADHAYQQGLNAANEAVQQIQNSSAAAMAAAQNQLDEVKNMADEIADKVADKAAEAKALAEDLKDKAEGLADQALAAAQEAKDKAEAAIDEVKQTVEEAKAAAQEKLDEAKQAVEDAKAAGQEKIDEAKQAVEEAKQQAEQAAEEVKEQAQQAVAEAEQAVEEAKQQAEQAVDEAKQQVEQAQQQAEQAVEEAKQQAEQAKEQAEQAVDEAKQQAEQAQEQAEQAVDDAKQAAEQVSDAAADALQSAQDAIPFG